MRHLQPGLDSSSFTSRVPVRYTEHLINQDQVPAWFKRVRPTERTPALRVDAQWLPVSQSIEHVFSGGIAPARPILFSPVPPHAAGIGTAVASAWNDWIQTKNRDPSLMLRRRALATALGPSAKALGQGPRAEPLGPDPA